MKTIYIYNEEESLEKTFKALTSKQFLSNYMISVSLTGLFGIDISDNNSFSNKINIITYNLKPIDILIKVLNKFNELYGNDYIILNPFEGRFDLLRKDKIRKTTLGKTGFTIHFLDENHSKLTYEYPSESIDDILSLVSNKDMKIHIDEKVFYTKYFLDSKQKKYEQVKEEYEKIKKLYDSFSDAEKLLGELYEESYEGL